MYTSSRCIPMPLSSFASSCPAAPTNGTPCLSSWKPGASPTNMRSAVAEPEPKTTCVRPFARAQRVQPATASPYAARLSSAVSDSVAATASVSTAAEGRRSAAGLDRRRLGLGGCEHRELTLHLRRAAVGALRRLVVADELFEVRLAAHADVFVDRHRGSNRTKSSVASSGIVSL